MLRLSRWFAIAVAGMGWAGALAQTELDTAPALDAARIWVATLDAGRYGASWENADPMLRETMTKVRWETSVEAARAPLGVMISRKIRQAIYGRGIPADPEAEICTIQYDTRFAQRPLTTEIVTTLRARDGTWRVAAYVLR